MVTADVQMTWKCGRKEGGGFANCIPALRKYMDYPHIASMACPKPMLFINSSNGKLFPVPEVKKAFGIMREVLDCQRTGDNLFTEIWPVPHYSGAKAQERVLRFFDEHLK